MYTVPGFQLLILHDTIDYIDSMMTHTRVNKPLFWLCQNANWLCQFAVFSLRTYRYIGVYLCTSQVSQEILNAVVLSALYLGYLLNYVSQFSNGAGPIHGLQNNSKARSKGPDSERPRIIESEISPG